MLSGCSGEYTWFSVPLPSWTLYREHSWLWLLGDPGCLPWELSPVWGCGLVSTCVASPDLTLGRLGCLHILIQEFKPYWGDSSIYVNKIFFKAFMCQEGNVLNQNHQHIWGKYIRRDAGCWGSPVEEIGSKQFYAYWLWRSMDTQLLPGLPESFIPLQR